MTQYGLTAEEVLYLAAVTGADTFYGVPDVLSGLPDPELKMKIVEIEDSLGAKGYLEEDFDGNRHILPALMEAVALCGNCEKILSFEKEQVGGPQYACMYFMQGNEAYKMECKEGEYSISGTALSYIQEEVEREMPGKTVEKKVEEESFSIRYEILEKASTLAKRGSAEKGMALLQEAGASSFLAQDIINGILNKADFYALLFLDFSREQDPGYSVQYLAGEGLTVMDYEIVDDEDYVRFTTADEAYLQNRLRRGWIQIGSLEERKMETEEAGWHFYG